jgi:glycosyltransferase involved in cell wall biosynthesis
LANQIVTDERAEWGDTYHLSVVIPAHNEAAHIEQTLNGLHSAFTGWDAEFVVVDDGSTDQTVRCVRRWQAHHADQPMQVLEVTPNQGKGQALVRGSQAARGRWIAWIDADGDIAPSQLVPLVDRAQQMDGIVVGSKQHQVWQTAGVPWWRRLMSRSFVIVIQMLYQLPVRDTQTGCKVFPGRWLRHATRSVHAAGYLLDLEVLVLAHEAALPMTEHPVMVTPQRVANRIGPRHIARSMGELVGVYRRTRRWRREASVERATHARLHA